MVIGFFLAGRMGCLDHASAWWWALLIGYSGVEMARFDLNVPEQCCLGWDGARHWVRIMWVPLSV